MTKQPIRRWFIYNKLETRLENMYICRYATASTKMIKFSTNCTSSMLIIKTRGKKKKKASPMQ